jgi:hypothetical protein
MQARNLFANHLNQSISQDYQASPAITSAQPVEAYPPAKDCAYMGFDSDFDYCFQSMQMTKLPSDFAY